MIRGFILTLLVLTSSTLFSQFKTDTIWVNVHDEVLNDSNDFYQYYVIEYKEGKRDSVSKVYNRERELVWKISMHGTGLGIKDGPAVMYYPTGEEEGKGFFIDDKQEGVWEYFHSTGQLREKGEYANGERKNKGWVYFSRDGKELPYGERMPYFKKCRNPRNLQQERLCGMRKINQLVGKNLKLPKEAIDNNMNGKVFLEFEIDKNGDVSNVSLLRTSGHKILDDAAIAAVKKLPKMIPGESFGEKVPVKYRIPIKIKIN